MVHANTWKLIQEMRKDYNLLDKDSKAFLMELMDGCGKQYRCGTALFLMAVTANHFGIPIDRMISCPGHGKGPVDAENGVTKTFLKMYFRLIKIWGVNKCDEGEHYLSACMVDDNAKKVSFAESLVRLLKDPKRKDGRKSSSKKYASREEKRKLKDRDYVACHAGTLDHEANTKILLENTKYVADGFDVAPQVPWKAKGGRKNPSGHPGSLPFLCLQRTYNIEDCC